MDKSVCENEHFNYEVQMLSYCYNMLKAGNLSPVGFNVYHESFCVHANNLFVFLRCVAPPEDYFKYKWMIEDQVLTLDLKARTSVFEEKIRFPKDHNRIIEIVELLLHKNGLEWKRPE